ncbi:MAG: HEPN domain-containing protein [Actinomycetota bacterium]|nr:HEPN domain-containing protein [Actinomycetota bacterium]MDQ3362856.1 HEPN domain-containing protein [Actinomycetota bacterium]
MSGAIEEARAFLDKAGRSFNAAAMLLQAGHTDFAVSRVYYGCFYVAEALLLTERLSFSRHSAVISEYGRLFAKTGRLDRRFHRLLQRTFAARHSADYDTNVDLDTAEVSLWLEEGKIFLDAAREYLKGQDPEDTAEQG